MTDTDYGSDCQYITIINFKIHYQYTVELPEPYNFTCRLELFTLVPTMGLLRDFTVFKCSIHCTPGK